MIHDETTTEIELPGKKKTESNIVHINFSSNALERRMPTNAPRSVATATAKRSVPHGGQKRPVEWYKDLDLGSPWFLRLIAVAMILALSLLIF